MKRTILALAAAATLLAPVAANAKIASNFGVSIQSCVVNKGGNGLTNGINVVYFNTREAPISEVDFLVKYHDHKAVLTDTGTFTHGAEVNHNLTNGLVSYPWYGPTPHLCTVQRLVMQSGKIIQ